MENDDQPTCGKGLAASSILPAKLAGLMAARAEVLERHTRALDLTDEKARMELDAYTRLGRTHRDIASALDRLASQMAGYRDLPQGEHDMAVMVDPKGQMEAFQQFVALERELLQFLTTKLEEDEAMLS